MFIGKNGLGVMERRLDIVSRFVIMFQEPMIECQNSRLPVNHEKPLQGGWRKKAQSKSPAFSWAFLSILMPKKKLSRKKKKSSNSEERNIYEAADDDQVLVISAATLP